jgi:nitrite reductase/ring-hydroxylating ferredoxin subunit
MALVEVGEIERLEHAKLTTVRAGGRDLVLVRWHDDVYALRNICPHMSTALIKGTILSRVGGDVVGEITFDHDDPIIACPWHQYEYALRDGRCLSDVGLRIRSYPVTIDGGKVLVDLQGQRGRRARSR